MDRSPSSPTIRQSEKLPSSSQPASTILRSISSQLTGCPLPWALALPPTSLSATIRYYHYTKLQKPQAAKGRSPAKLELLSVDASRTPAENVWRPASTIDRRDICLLLTQDAGCLKASKRAGAPKSPGP